MDSSPGKRAMSQPAGISVCVRDMGGKPSLKARSAGEIPSQKSRIIAVSMIIMTGCCFKL
jgi:hypothetical protein